MSANTLMNPPNIKFINGLAGVAGYTPPTITTGTVTANNGITCTAGNISLTSAGGNIVSAGGVVATGEVLGGTVVSQANITAAGTINAGGNITTTNAEGTISLTNNDVGDTTFNSAGLTFARNLSGGRNEYDIIAFNPTTPAYALSIYVSSGADITNASIPSVVIGNAGVILTSLTSASIVDGAGSTGNAGQLITAQGDGSWLWADPA
jgi:hypothetical protein